MDVLRAALERAGQAHLLERWEALSPEEQANLQAQLQDIDFDYLRHIFQASLAEGAGTVAPPEPVRDVLTLKDATEAQRAAWRASGLSLIAEGKLAVLLLAGGQGTRLGSAAPKGCYNIGLPSRKSLFHLQAERLLHLQTLAAEHAHGPGAAPTHPLRWYVMTSPATDAATRRHFEENGFFGLRPAQVVFFQQGQLPAMTEEGRVILEAPGRPAMSPDGNGGVYVALARAGVLDDMAAHGVEAVDCYCVDNALARLGDPVFAGFCAERGVECGARVVAKASPEEKVGVFARRGGRLEVVEYSELDPAEAAAADPATGELKYGWSNICMHYFRRDWLAAVAGQLAAAGRYHIARKKIPSVGGPVQGIKLELFIFDTFPLAASTALFEVARGDEFAPVKNAPGQGLPDSPDTARDAILALHKGWVQAAGGTVTCAGVEVSPLVSYAGEGLEGVCAGKEFKEAFNVHLQGFLQRLQSGAGSGQYASPRPVSFKGGPPFGAAIQVDARRAAHKSRG